MSERKIRVFHAPTTVGGNPPNLSKSLKVLGIESTALTLVQNYYNYPVDHVLWSQEDGKFCRELKRLKAIVIELLHYDVIHFNAGTTLAAPISSSVSQYAQQTYHAKASRAVISLYTNVLQLIELTALRFLDKPIFITYQGDDARQGDYCLKNFKFSIATQVDSNYYNKITDKFKRRNIRRLARYCDQIYSLNPDLLHVLPQGSRFIPYSHIDLDEWTPVYSQAEQRPLRILHAPSHRKVKGTDLLLLALDRLKSEGYNFELLIVEGMSNAEARKIYDKADVLVDQLFAGWYGGLAVELMALGKPVIVYIRDEDLHFIPEQMRQDLPFINVTPDSIDEGLRFVLELPRSELVELGKRSRAYVERWHDPLKIAAEIKADYELALAKRKKRKG